MFFRSACFISLESTDKRVFFVFRFSVEATDPTVQFSMDTSRTLHISFSAAHIPLQAPQEWLDRFASIEQEDRRIYVAMVACVDEAVGNITAALEEAGDLETTVLVSGLSAKAVCLTNAMPLLLLSLVLGRCATTSRLFPQIMVE